MEEEGEDVDNVQVDAESGKDVLFWAHGVPLVPHEELGVKCQELQRKQRNGTYVVRPV